MQTKYKHNTNIIRTEVKQNQKPKYKQDINKIQYNTNKINMIIKNKIQI